MARLRVGAMVAFVIGCLLFAAAAIVVSKVDMAKVLLVTVMGATFFLSGVVLVAAGNIVRAVESLPRS